MKKDPVKAFALFLKAAEMGDDIAHRSLGYCYEKGKGVKKDLDKAELYYQLAVDMGVEEALEDLVRVVAKRRE